MNELFTKEFDSESNDEEYIPTKKELEKSNEEIKNKKNENIKVNKSKVDAIWEKLKQQTRPNNNNKLSEKENSNNKIDNKKTINEIEKEKERQLEEEIKEAIKKSKEQKEKTVTEKYYFAGQEFEEKKEINEKEVEKLKKKQTNKELDAIINEIAKKRNISTMDKSKKDWKNYVEKHNIEKELMNNRKDGFLGKKKFIDETNEIVTEQNRVSIKKAKYAYENKVNGK